MVQLYASFRKPKLPAILLLQCILVLCAIVNSHAQSAPPTITSFTPMSGKVGDEITISGTNFSNATLLYIGSGIATKFTIVSDTEIKVKVHQYAATGKLQVRSNNSIAYSSTDFTVADAPIISGFSPSSGPVGTEVTITGKNFTGVYSVYIGNGSTTDFTLISDTELRVRVPALATTGRLVVRTNNGQVTSSTDFTVAGAPIISGFSPSSGPVGTEVTITGKNFTGVYSISIGNGSTTDFTLISDTELRVRVPALASTGRLVVRTNNGQVTSSTDFTVAGAPIISGFSPSSGPVGTEVTITGKNFTGATHVYIGSGTIESSAFLSINDNEIKVKVPYLASTGSILVRSPNGQGYAPGTFTIDGAPVINSFTPVSGPVGTIITVFGQNFTGTTGIYINNVYTTSFSVISNTELKITVPDNAVTGKMRIIASGGSVYSSEKYTVTSPAAITLTPTSLSFTDVPSGSIETKSYQVSGEGLTNGTPVSINIGDATSPFTIATSENGEYSRSIPLSGVTNNRLSATTIWVKYAPLSPTPDGAPQTGSIVHTQGSTSGTLSLNATAVGPMPVELAYFTAKSKEGSVVLEWKTASEENNSHFEVEMAIRSLDNFAKVATVASKASNSTSLTYYKHQQKLVNYGQTLYFRLKQVDLDGTFSYSKTVSVEPLIQQESMQPLVAPNPVTSNSRLILTSNESVKATMYLSSLAGKRILTKAIIVLKGHNEIDLPMLSTLEKGMYILNIELDGRMHQVKVIKN